MIPPQREAVGEYARMPDAEPVQFGERGPDALCAAVAAVVVGQRTNVDTGFAQRRGQRKWRTETGIAGIVARCGERGFEIDGHEVRGGEIGRHALENGRIVVRPVRTAGGEHLRKMLHHVAREQKTRRARRQTGRSRIPLADAAGPLSGSTGPFAGLRRPERNGRCSVRGERAEQVGAPGPTDGRLRRQAAHRKVRYAGTRSRLRGRSAARAGMQHPRGAAGSGHRGPQTRKASHRTSIFSVGDSRGTIPLPRACAVRTVRRSTRTTRRPRLPAA